MSTDPTMDAKAGTGFDVPLAYRAMVEDGSVLHGDDPNGYSFVELMRRAKPPALLCASVTWLHPFEIEDALVASRATSSVPVDAGKEIVTALEVRGAWRHEIPFARESGRGWWCWKSDWTVGGARRSCTAHTTAPSRASRRISRASCFATCTAHAAGACARRCALVARAAPCVSHPIHRRARAAFASSVDRDAPHVRGARGFTPG